MKRLRVHNIEETSVNLDKIELKNECMLIKYISQKILYRKNILKHISLFLIEKSKRKENLYYNCKPIICSYSGRNIDHFYEI